MGRVYKEGKLKVGRGICVFPAYAWDGASGSRCSRLIHLQVHADLCPRFGPGAVLSVGNS